MSASPQTHTELAGVLEAAAVRLEVEGPVATVTMAAPHKRNAMTPATWRAFAAVNESLGADVRVVVIRGEGASFSAGLDRGMFTPEGVDGESLVGLLDLDDEAMVERIEEFQHGFTWLRRPDLVSIAAVQGHAIGGGFQLALSCDLRVLAEDAQLCMKEPALGLVPDLTGTKPLVDSVGYSRALEICATSRYVGAAEAREIGLATTVVPTTELSATVADLAAALCEPDRDVVAGTKALLQGAGERDLDNQRLAERRAQVPRLRALGALIG